jgi:GNAT superfamily N-acetyltransferase
LLQLSHFFIMDSPLLIRALRSEEMNLPIEWAAKEGWNPGRHDGAAFHAADPEGFLVAEMAGRRVGVMSAVKTGERFGFLGFYIVAPEERGKGHGMALWRAAMARLEGRTVGLDGVLAQQANYARSGFVLAHRNVRHGGVAPSRETAEAANRAEGLRPAQAVPFAELAVYDAAHFGCERTAFLRAWLALPESRARVLLRGGAIAGYGVARRCGEGVKIGPLFADDEAGAETLFAALAGLAPGERVFLDTPEPTAAAVALARRHGLEPVFETARMYRGPAPVLPLARIYGITSFELG